MSKNDVTGDNIITKASTEAYGAGWEALWGKKKNKTPAEVEIERLQELFEDDVVDNKL